MNELGKPGESVDFLKREMARFHWRRGAEHDFFFTNKQVREAVKSFDKHSRGLGFPVWRTELATLRVFDPIIAWPRLRYKLSDEEILRLVKAGYHREALLLSVERNIV